MDRRQFLALLSGAAAVLAVTPADGANRATRQLVVIELAGGNDSLNTYIPYRHPTYVSLRPTIAIRDGIPVSDRVAFHPGLAAWKPWLDQGSLAVIQNVHYPQPSFSHFRSREIWQSATPVGQISSGWLGRYLESRQARSQDAVFLGDEYPLALMGESTYFLQLAPNLLTNRPSPLDQAIQQIYGQPSDSVLAEAIRAAVIDSTRAVKTIREEIGQQGDRSGFPKSAVGNRLALVSRLVLGGVPVVYTTVSGWDTHARQVPIQHKALSELGEAVAALRRDIQTAGLERQVLIMLQSEFGRRPKENGNSGTDHGAAGALTLMGPLKSGLYGGEPALDHLVNGNLPEQVDFRQVYAEIVRWLGGEPKKVLGRDYQPLGILTS